MPDQQHKIEVLNRFMGWEPRANLMRLPLRHKHDIPEVHEKDDWCPKAGCCPIVDTPFNPYTDTHEARQWTRLLKDEFVRRTHQYVEVLTSPQESTAYCCYAGTHDKWAWSAIEHHAILDAIYEVIKDER